MHSTLSLSLISPKEVLTSLQCIQIHLGYLGFVVLISFRCRLDLAGRSNASLNLMAETPWVKQAARFGSCNTSKGWTRELVFDPLKHT
jgi:hypothetical protein